VIRVNAPAPPNPVTTLTFTVSINYCTAQFTTPAATVTLKQHTVGESLSNVVTSVSKKNTQTTCSLTSFSFGNVADNLAPNPDVFTFSETAGVVTVTIKENILANL